MISQHAYISNFMFLFQFILEKILMNDIQKSSGINISIHIYFHSIHIDFHLFKIAIIIQVIEIFRYTKKAKSRSKIMHDKPMTQRETIVFWVEYVVRHGGAEHLRVGGQKLHWYQYLLLDVILFTIISIGSIVLLVVFLLKKLITTLCKNRSKKKKE